MSLPPKASNSINMQENDAGKGIAIEYIVWPTFYVNNGDVAAFRARFFNSLHKSEFIPRICQIFQIKVKEAHLIKNPKSELNNRFGSIKQSNSEAEF